MPVVAGRLHRLEHHPRLIAMVVGFGAAAAGTLTGGPIAGLMLGVYLGFSATAWLHYRRSRRATRRRTQVLDAIGTIGADLRAGLSPAAALAAAFPALDQQSTGDDRADAGSVADRVVGRATARLAAAWQISERLGTPLADLLDRVESDLRAAERVRLTAAAQTAGARATTWLLAGLPAAGVAIGFSLGVDPVHSLLHTRLGAGCAVAALALQSAGVGWSGWLTRLTMDEVDA